MNLVVGATGRLGSEVCGRLLARAHPVRAMVRESSSPAAVARLQRAGAEIAVAELGEPASLSAACRGVRTVMCAAPGPRRQPALIDAARDAGVSRFVYVSLSGLVTGRPPLERETDAVERHLRTSGFACTILRPTFVMNTWLSPIAGFDLAARRVRLYGSGDERVGWIAAEDVADVAVACVERPPVDRPAVELCGPDSLSPLEIVELAEQIGGRSIEVERVPMDVLEQQADETFAALLIRLAGGVTMTAAPLSPHLPQPRTPVRHFLRRAL